MCYLIPYPIVTCDSLLFLHCYHFGPAHMHKRPMNLRMLHCSSTANSNKGRYTRPLEKCSLRSQCTSTPRLIARADLLFPRLLKLTTMDLNSLSASTRVFKIF